MPFKQTSIMYVPVPAQMPFNWSLFPRSLRVLATGCFVLALANTAQGSHHNAATTDTLASAVCHARDLNPGSSPPSLPAPPPSPPQPSSARHPEAAVTDSDSSQVVRHFETTLSTTSTTSTTSATSATTSTAVRCFDEMPDPKGYPIVGTLLEYFRKENHGRMHEIQSGSHHNAATTDTLASAVCHARDLNPGSSPPSLPAPPPSPPQPSSARHPEAAVTDSDSSQVVRHFETTLSTTSATSTTSTTSATTSTAVRCFDEMPDPKGYSIVGTLLEYFRKENHGRMHEIQLRGLPQQWTELQQ